MSRTSAEEQLSFLLTCVKHSANGKVDFGAVATECDIVSKGAAAKRYERLLKANNATPAGNGQTDDAEPPTPSEPATPKKARKAPASKAGTPKSTTTTPRKRKGAKATAAGSPIKKSKSSAFVREEEGDNDGSASDNETKVKKENEEAVISDDNADHANANKQTSEAHTDTEIEA